MFSEVKDCPAVFLEQHPDFDFLIVDQRLAEWMSLTGIYCSKTDIPLPFNSNVTHRLEMIFVPKKSNFM